MVAPILEKISNDRTDVQVVKLNVDECGELAEQYGVASIPTMVVLKNGEVTNVKTGLCPEEEILNLLV